MTAHDGSCSGVDSCFPDSSVKFHPLIKGEEVCTDKHVLVTVIHTVAGEVFACSCHEVIFLETANDIFEQRDNLIGIIAEGADICDRVFRIQVEVDNRGECPMNSGCAAHTGSNFTHHISCVGDFTGSDTHLSREFHAGITDEVCSVFHICGDQDGNFAVGLDRAVDPFHFFQISSACEHASDGVLFKKFNPFGFAPFTVVWVNQLKDFFFHCQGRENGICPALLFFIQGKKHCVNILYIVQKL